MNNGAANRKVLIIEDSGFIGKMLLDGLQRKSHFQPIWVQSLSAAKRLLDQKEIFTALVDYSLPDAMNGEAIIETTGRNIPTIVFTGHLDNAVREKVWQLRVVDYVLKDHVGSFHYLLSMLNRLEQNMETWVMVVDDTRTFRKLLARLLEVHLYQVIEAENGEEALAKLAENPNVKLVICDYYMPEMDGFILTYKIRELFQKRIAIIGISSGEDPLMAARFIKNGANDFITKQSFIAEEFYSRITQSVDSIFQMEQLQEASVRDFMTNLHNRRYFFDVGQQLFANASRRNLNIACAMIDIDHFKQINDTWGHDAGDQAICAVAEIIRSRMRKGDIVARLGGEEFGILTINNDIPPAWDIFDRLRQEIEIRKIRIDTGKNIQCTVSIGVAMTLGRTLEEMIKQADNSLYQAKDSGRNKVVTD